MPVLVHKRSPHSYAVLPISLLTTISLAAVLFYLQFLYLISFVLRPFWPSRYDFPPFRLAIEQAERIAVDILLGIVPPAIYRSPMPSTLLHHEDPLGQRLTTALRGSHACLDSIRSAPPRIVDLPPLPQCYPPSPPPPTPHTHENKSHATGPPAPSSPGPGPGTGPDLASKCTPSASALYDTVKKSNPANSPRPRISPPLEPALLLAEQVTQHVTKRRNEQQVVEIVQTRPAPPVPDSPRPCQKSPAVSFDGPSEPGVLSASSHYTDDSTSLNLDAARGAKCRSTESYPGKFPVSEGMEFSSLATAEYAFRERGTTSVRPFSDY
ncbi:hypothetical protein N7462_007870 [Penicillium macrosclerotiorum]|uniref:uncharacterized protein n=1 Tax=Penicillium macrosclerotiorum TaxID=303699 RepID=UPI002549B583|nr:uncharacterized protein N7462_007870 [Penicillium macrosclerotiorum]KAJ5679626.1 hypothetical protein N7462_007870 [Penicillium macrosclerotiorum]